MKIFCLLLLFLLPFPSFADQKGNTHSRNVMNGEPIPTGEAPWIARIIIGWSNGERDLCTGSLIDAHWVLTAAHCFREDGATLNRQRTSITLGEDSYIGEVRKGDEIGRIILHPGHKRLFQDDLALVELLNPSSQEPIRLLPVEPEVGTPVTIMGFGGSEKQEYPSIAQKGSANLLDWDFCADYVLLGVQYFCAGSGAYGAGGDSGGIWAIPLEQGGWGQIAVTKGGKDISFTVLTVSIKISAIHDWILEYTTAPREDVPDFPDPSLEEGVPISRHWVIPTSANAKGRYGGTYKTSMILANLDREQGVNIEVKLYGPKGLTGESIIEIPDYTYHWYDDFLHEIFEYQGAGALEFTADRPFSISRVEVWIDTDSGRNTTVVSALPFPLRPYSGNAISLGVNVSERYRTNIGVFNSSSNQQTIQAKLGSEVIEFNLPPKTWSQKSISSEVSRGQILWYVPEEAYLYVVEVDNTSQDGTLTYPIPRN